jgi:hypothetical protein
MTAAAPLLSPGSRVVAGWWRSLTPWRPQALWLGSLAIHHVEALVRVADVHTVDRFRLLLLDALRKTPAGTAEGLEARLHLGTQFVNQALRGLAAEGLAHAPPSKHWSLTPLGLEALRDGRYVQTTLERRGFHFLDGGRASQAPAPSPQFLNLTHFSCSAWTAPGDFRFDPALLQVCIDQQEDWKEQHGFPGDVRELLLPATAPGPDGHEQDPLLRLWQRIVLDRPERLVAVLILAPTEQGGEGLLAFEMDPEGWRLETAPVLNLGADWRRMLPDLAEEPPLESWRQAWQGWCQQRSLPVVEAEACHLERRGYQLRVKAPARLFDRLHAARSDALKGEAWLLAGNGRIRTAAQVEVHKADAAPVQEPV